MTARRALSMVEQRAGNRRVRIEDRLPRRAPTVSANGQEVEQVFLNLLLNALDAMPGGGRLTLSAWTEVDKQDREWLAVTVQDTGMGIPEDVRGRIFEPFYTTKPAGKGTGLGLSICQGLVKSYGGSIDLESTEGSGTCVTVRFPTEAEQAEVDHA